MSRAEIDLMNRKYMKLEANVLAIQDGIRNRQCTKESDFRRINTTLTKLGENIQMFATEIGSWKFFKTMFFALLVVMLTTIGLAIYEFAQLQTQVTNMQSKFTSKNIDEKLNKIQSSLDSIESKKKDRLE